jgi:outer membrane protein TolC
LEPKGSSVLIAASKESTTVTAGRNLTTMPDRRKSSLPLAAAVCLLSALVPLSAGAQTPELPPVPSGPLTLDQVLQLTEPRSESVAIAQATVRRAEGDQVRAQSGLRPQLSASASYDRALASEFEGLFDTTSTGSSDLSGFEDLPFGRKNTWRATLAFSQNLYSGGRNGAQVAVASVGHETAQLGLTTTRAELLFEVTQAYYDAVLSERLVTIALATLDQASATLRQTEAGFSAGTQPEFEVLRARVARDNQLPTLIRQRVNRDISFLRLKRLLDLPANVDLQLADALGEEALPPPPVFAERVAAVEQMFRADDLVSASLATTAALPERTAVAQAAANVRLREASLKLTEAQRMPSLSLNSTYSRIAYPNDALPHFDRSNWSLGVSVSVPVLTGGRQRGDEQVARAELDQSRLQRQQTEELAALDTRSTWAALLAARAQWDSTAGTVQQADRAYTIADVRYTAGVSTQLELADARLLLRQAEANRAQAARDLQVARARVALLPDLPIGAGLNIGTAASSTPLQTPQGPVQPQGGSQLRNASVQGFQSQAGTQ